jgi:mannose-1-phosphate guanylyltransferase
MDYKILSASSPEELTKLNAGWKPVGSHSVVETHRQNRYRGQQHIDTLIKHEYSQTIITEIQK